MVKRLLQIEAMMLDGRIGGFQVEGCGLALRLAIAWFRSPSKLRSDATSRSLRFFDRREISSTKNTTGAARHNHPNHESGEKVHDPVKSITGISVKPATRPNRGLHFPSLGRLTEAGALKVEVSRPMQNDGSIHSQPAVRVGGDAQNRTGDGGFADLCL